MPKLIHAFNKIDKQRAQLNRELLNRITLVLPTYYPSFKLTTENRELFNNFGTHIQNITESVVDKDRNYSNNRMEEELEMMNKLAMVFYPAVFPVQLYDVFLTEIKAFMVDSNKSVYSLSGSGFRLLDANAKVFLIRFVNSIIPHLS